MGDQDFSPEIPKGLPDQSLPKDLIVGDKRIKPGEIVKVQRTSGEIEPDWTLTSFGSKFAVVQKEDSKEGVLQKIVPIEEFRTLQAEQQPNEQESAKYFRSFIVKWHDRFIELQKAGIAGDIKEGMVGNSM